MAINDSRAVLASIALLLLSPGVARATPRHAFVTSTAGSGDLSTWANTEADGLTGADEICQALAGFAALTNASTYRAWLSTETTDAYCHLFGLTGTQPSCGGANPDPATQGPWVRMDGEIFAGTLDELTGNDTLLYQPLLFDEHGIEVRNEEIWTDTNYHGGKINVDLSCASWSSTSGSGDFGYSDVVGRGWTYWSGQACSSVNRLLCLEPGAGDPAPKPPVTGAMAFITSTVGTGDLSTWAETDADDLAGADEICKTRAAAGHLPNASTFFAFMSNGAVDAIDRITYPGPFVRVDGLVFADQKADLFQPLPALRTGIVVSETGAPLGANALQCWDGTLSDGTAAANRCGDWSLGGGTTGAEGDPMEIDAGWVQSSIIDCSADYHLYCFSNVEILFWDNFERGTTRRWSNGAP